MASNPQPPRGRGRARGRGRFDMPQNGNSVPPAPGGVWGQQRVQQFPVLPQAEHRYAPGEPRPTQNIRNGQPIVDAGKRQNDERVRGRVNPENNNLARPANAFKGTSGKPVILKANYFQLLHRQEWNLFQYRIDFAPEEDRTPVKKALLRRAVNGKVSGYLFDGTVMYVPVRLEKDTMELFVDDKDDNKIRITLRLVATVAADDFHRLQVLNIILRKCMGTLKLQLLGRNFFDAIAKIDVPDFRLELWPGYITSIREHKHSILLCAEITHKVLRTDTVLHLLKEMFSRERSNFKAAFANEIADSIVLTTYNNRTYRVDDVDWSVTPNSTFQKADGTSVSYVEYYKNRYNIVIRDIHQPMLVSRSKAREIRAGMPDYVYLVPELCRMTGLTNAQRDNFQLMKALAVYTRVGPASRLEKLQNMCKRLREQPEAVQELKKWDLKLADKVIEFSGRELAPEMILGGANVRYSAGSNTEWTRSLRANPMHYGASMNRWIVIYPRKYHDQNQNFVNLLRKTAQGMFWNLVYPERAEIHDDRTYTYTKKISDIINEKYDIMLIVIPNKDLTRYNAIKSECCRKSDRLSQLVVARNLDSKGAMSIATKIVVQMNAKLGGIPWTVQLPTNYGMMIVGFDVYHDTKDKKKSFGATVSSINRHITKYFSVTTPHRNGEELSSNFGKCILNACDEYRRIENCLPSLIIIYRDGVGEGQLQEVEKKEVNDIKRVLGQHMYTKNQLKMAFVIVAKRINTRMFKGNENVAPGTIVDDHITLKGCYDFLLTSQCVNQGTATPTYYNIVDDNTGLSADELQRLTYKMTHLYYNWAGTVRVPAPCQYAHKLAMLAGQHLHDSPHVNLNKTLHFL